jgi:hypothetical protein
MARWKLTSSHYLTVQGTAWEQIEVDRMSGKQIRKRYDVPLQLDVADTSLWNGNIIRNPRGEVLGGDIIVAHADGEHLADDYIFRGNPTPDMFPLDDEAKALSAKFEKVWNAKPDEEITYGRRMIERIEEVGQRQHDEARTMKVEGLEDVLKGMAELMAMNQALMAQLIPAKVAERRV